MRNLKKILSLALALMMILSVTASAAFTDAAKIDADYAEAAAVLNGMKVFQGYEDGSFLPTKAITRAEVAAIIYRIDTKDVEDEDVALYVDSASFSDVKAADWFSGYVGYCANAGYIKGYPDGTFLPNKTVTGFEALAMILRAMGYDAENEFSGAQWSQNIAKIATKAGILDVVKPGQLTLPGTREMVAQLLFDAINAKTVKFYPAWGYLENATKLADLFALTKVTGNEVNDEWGRPAYKWTYNTGDKKTVFAIEPEAKYYTAVTECEVAEAGDFDDDDKVTLYVNNSTIIETINPLDTIDTVGAQGRLTEVYEDRIVMIDTWLAKVTDVTDATFDARGHLATESRIDLKIYDNAVGTDYYMTNEDTNYTYSAGDMVLVYSYAKLPTIKLKARDEAGAITATADAAGDLKLAYCEIKGLAKSEVGAQTVIWSNVAKHTINNVTYMDAAEFNFDQAGEEISNHTWYFDQYGNVIGAANISTKYDYAVLKNIWWSGDATTGSGKAMGTLVYMDGSENVVVIDEINNCETKYSTIWSDVMKFENETVRVATDAATNATRDNVTGTGYIDAIKGHLFRVTTYTNGSVDLDMVTDGATVPAHTELNTNVAITNKYAYITGNNKYVAIDTNTQFLVRKDSETAGFTTYTGLNAIPTFASITSVDYVLGSNGVAKYVYVIGTPISAFASDFVLVKEGAIGAYLSTTADNVSYWTVSLPIPAEDGTEAVIKMKNDATGLRVYNELTKATNVGKLYYIDYENGYAVDYLEITGLHQYDADIANGRAIKLTASTYVNGVIASGNYRFNVTEATVVIGELKANMDKKVVYVIYDATNTVASKVYVCDVDPAQTGTVLPADPTKANIQYVVKVIDASGKELNVLTVASWAPVGAQAADTVSYAGLINSMIADAADWTNADGAVATMTAMGIYNASLTGVADAARAACKVGETVTVTFVVKAQ